MAALDDLKRAKLEKKARKAAKLAAAANVEATLAEPDSAGTPPKKKKRKEKLNKSEKDHPDSVLEVGKAGTIEAMDDFDEKKPKKRKKTDTVESGHGAVTDDSPTVQADQRKKKKKKQKTAVMEDMPVGRRVAETAAPDIARIGNAARAKEGKPLRKNLYEEHREVASMSGAAVTAWQEERDIAVEGSSLRPIQQFHQAGLPEALLHATRTFVSPSPIQGQCLPIALSGRDLVGIAATGSGKTIAFGLPCLRHIQAQQEAAGSTNGAPRALMLSPTRELAQQIAAVMEEAGQKCGIRTACVYGGVPKVPQAKQLKRGVEIVVATPGRLEDLMNDGACKLEQISYLVLDEADRMLDLGFEPHIRAIASQTRADRQTLMFSATWPSEVQRLAMDYMSNPARVVIGSQDLSASHSVTQIVEVIDPESREARLLQLLKKYHSSRKNRVLVFVLYKKEASRVEERLNRAGWKAASIHGDISQNQRSKAVEQFKSGAMPLLIATDVAARGLDIPDVEAVINYSFPLTTEDYVHRIGRTGRAGKSGIAHTFFSGATDKARSGELINVLREAGQTVPEALLKFGTTTKKKESKMYGAHFKEIDLSQKATKIVFDD